jgi:hypothetical protein
MKKPSALSTFLFILSIFLLAVSIIAFIISFFTAGHFNYLISIYIIILSFILAFYSHLLDLERES